MSDAPQCCKPVRNSGRWPSYHPCRCAASVERDGHHYCKTHDPVRRAEKNSARTAAWDAEWKAKRERSERERLCVWACDGLTNEQLKKLAGFDRQILSDTLADLL